MLFCGYCMEYSSLYVLLIHATGTLQIYFNLQATVWWTTYVAILFWQVQFPFRANICKRNGHNKYIYIGLLLISVVVPVLPFIAVIVSGGYGTWKFSPSICTYKSLELAFYGLALPFNLPPIIGTPLMITIIASLIKVLCTA